MAAVELLLVELVELLLVPKGEGSAVCAVQDSPPLKAPLDARKCA